MNYPYGQCHLCDGPITYPGLDYFFCGGNCQRWVRVETVRPQLPLAQPLPLKKAKPAQLFLLEGGEG